MNDQLIALLQEYEQVHQLIIRYEALLMALHECGTAEAQGYASLAEETFLPAVLPERDRLLVHVGANIMIEASLEEAEAFYQQRLIRLREVEAVLRRELERMGVQG